MSVIIKRIQLNQRKDSPSLAVFLYFGNEDPVKKLDEAIDKYVEGNDYYEFIDSNMDNPWTRVIVKDIDRFPKDNLPVEGREFYVYRMHSGRNVEVNLLEYANGADARPYPIMDIALMTVTGTRGYNSYIQSDLSDMWSRLVIFGINEMDETPFTNQKI